MTPRVENLDAYGNVMLVGELPVRGQRDTRGTLERLLLSAMPRRGREQGIWYRNKGVGQPLPSNRESGKLLLGYYY